MPKSKAVTSIARAVLEHLRGEFRHADHGGLRRVSVDLGLQPDHLSKMIRRGRMDVGVLFGALRSMEIRPEVFVHGATESLPPTSPPAQPALVEQRLALRSFLDDTGSSQPEGWSESPDEWLLRLDELRYDDGDAALQELRSPPFAIPKRLAARYLGVCGSAYRNAGARLHEADLCLRTATWMAEASGDRALIAELSQRSAYVLADQARFAEALFLVERAGGLYLSLGDRAGAGKTLVDQGIFLGYLERFDEAIRASETALELLPDEEVRNRCAALHSLARHHKSLGEPRRALDYLESADVLSDQIGGWLRAKIHWFKGELLLAGGAFAEAESHLAIAFEIYRSRSPLALALVAVDLLLAQRRQDRLLAVRDTLRATIPLIDQLHDNRLATSALMELFRCRLSEVSPQLIHQVKARLEAALKSKGSASVVSRPGAELA